MTNNLGQRIHNAHTLRIEDRKGSLIYTAALEGSELSLKRWEGSVMVALYRTGSFTPDIAHYRNRWVRVFNWLDVVILINAKPVEKLEDIRGSNAPFTYENRHVQQSYRR